MSVVWCCVCVCVFFLTKFSAFFASNVHMNAEDESHRQACVGSFFFFFLSVHKLEFSQKRTVRFVRNEPDPCLRKVKTVWFLTMLTDTHVRLLRRMTRDS